MREGASIYGISAVCQELHIYYLLEKSQQPSKVDIIISITDEKMRFKAFQKLIQHSTIERNELSGHEEPWRNLKCILPSKGVDLKRPHAIWFQLYDILAKAKP